MSLAGEEFRQEYKPLHISAYYDQADTLHNNLGKITQANDGATDPDLLATGPG